MITHVVTFRWKDDISSADIAAIADALATMPVAVPTIKTYNFGSNLGINPTSNMDFAIVATFESIDDWREYDVNPHHEKLRAEVIRPWVAERAALQFES